MFQPTQGDGAIPSWTATSYDGLGRVTSTAFNSDNTQQWATTTSYPGHEPDRRQPADRRHRDVDLHQHPRADHRQLAVHQRHRSQRQPGRRRRHRLHLHAAGQVKTVTDDAGNTWTYGYDLLGHKTSESDPGTTQSATSTYDAAGNIATTTDPDGNELSYKYDLLGRKTAIYLGSLTTGTVLDSWTYDQATLGSGPAKALGQLSSSTSNDSFGGESGGPYTEQVTGYNAAYQATGTIDHDPGRRPRARQHRQRHLHHHEHLHAADRPAGIRGILGRRRPAR